MKRELLIKNYKKHEAREEVEKWSRIFPGYRKVVDDIREMLHHRSQTRGTNYEVVGFPTKRRKAS